MRACRTLVSRVVDFSSMLNDIIEIVSILNSYLDNI
jgi:hypothetical protein